MSKLFGIYLLLNLVLSVPAVAMAIDCNEWGNGRYENLFPLTRLAYWLFDSCAGSGLKCK